MKVFKFQANSGLILNGDSWPYSGSHSSAQESTCKVGPPSVEC